MNTFLGVDCGQASDPAAYALLERKTFARRVPSEPITTYSELHATAYTRFALRTPYTEIVRRIAAIVQIPDWYGMIAVIVDCTRERAVYDIMRESKDMYGATVIPIVLTGGNHTSQDEYGWYKVPEAEILAALIVALEGNRLKASRDGGQGKGDAEALNEQFANVRRRVTVRRNAVGMTTDGTDVPHDDLAFSVGYATWYAKMTGAFEGPYVHRPDEVKPFDPARAGLTE